MKHLIMLCLCLGLMSVVTSRASAQVEVFQHSHYRGQSLQLAFGQYADLKRFGMNDKISSFWIDSGVQVTFYQATGFQEKSWTLTGPCQVSELPATECAWWSDRISSISVQEIRGTSWQPNSGRWNGRAGCAEKTRSTAPDNDYHGRNS